MRTFTVIIMAALAAATAFAAGEIPPKVVTVVAAGNKYYWVFTEQPVKTADEIPPTLKKEAEKVFAADKAYFIWIIAEQPVKPVKEGVLESYQSFAFVTVRFAARNPTNTPAFRIKTAFIAVEPDNKTTTPFITTAPGTNSAFEGKPLGDHVTAVMSDRQPLRGLGMAKVWLISADDKAADGKAISNTVDLKVDFTDKK